MGFICKVKPMSMPNWPLMYFEEHVMESSEGCREWPGAKRKGYGRLHMDGRDHYVHRLTCQRWYGPPGPAQQTAHSCGNRICWAGEHLRWATPKDNDSDKDAHGTRARGERHGMARLSDVQVEGIRQTYAAAGRPNRGENSQSGLARRYGTTVATINNIVHNRTRV